ncbi:SMP-30/gluconolactonase/LRE family protein [Adhaeribacter aquaticus]|uniref:SMP-30/gluconolactonase/LRE family protein n=1 Tax=Adhaeribacter aquaticus TaxID=299567 RepID=UPI00041F5602|nr:PQQ-binding-like beta-propeller repeat protein [Adhaeribacter aquaticus]
MKINKNKILVAALVINFFNLKEEVTAQSLSLTKKWEASAGLNITESVVYDKRQNILYVSSVNGQPGDKDGNGFISRVSLDGRVEQAEWVTGLDAPKGMSLYKGLLYVVDITKVVAIDAKSGKKVREIPVEGASFLNDLTIDEKGNVYASDSNLGLVFKITNDQPELWLKSEQLKRVNGILAHNNKFYLLELTGGGIFYEVDKTSKALRKIAQNLGGSDGITPLSKNEFLVTNFGGEINHVSATGQVTKLIDTKADKVNAADLTYIPKKKLVLVPTFYTSKVVAYELKK